MLPANAYTIRPATETDGDTLRRLATLEMQRPLEGAILVAEDDGVLVAALSLDQRRTVANPFEPSATAIALLRARAEALHAQGFVPPLRERLLAPLRGLRRGQALSSLSA